MNQWKALPSWLIQQASLPSSVVYFPPTFRSWALDHFSFPSPLHSAQFCHPAKETNQRALSLSLHTFPLSHSAFLCLCPLMVWSAPYCLSTTLWPPPPPAAYDVTLGAKAVGKWPEVKWARVQRAFLGVVNCPFFPLRRVLPLFGESVSCFKKSVLPFKEFQSGSLSPYFSSKLIWWLCTCQLSCYRACYLYQ